MKLSAAQRSGQRSKRLTLRKPLSWNEGTDCFANQTLQFNPRSSHLLSSIAHAIVFWTMRCRYANGNKELLIATRDIEALNHRNVLYRRRQCMPFVQREEAIQHKNCPSFLLFIDEAFRQAYCIRRPSCLSSSLPGGSLPILCKRPTHMLPFRGSLLSCLGYCCVSCCDVVEPFL